MIAQKIQQTQQMSHDTGAHIAWYGHQVAKTMTDAEITQFAAAEGSRRFVGTAERAITGTNSRTGVTLSKYEQQEERDAITVMIASCISGKLIEMAAAASR